MGYSPRGCKESDTTERLHFHFQWQDEPFKGTHQKLLIMLEYTYILDILVLIYWVGQNVSSVCFFANLIECKSITIYVAIQPTLTEKSEIQHATEVHTASISRTVAKGKQIFP